MHDAPLGPPLARGRTADIHAWEDGYVLKLFHDWFDLESIRYEERIAHAVGATGLPVPRPGGIVQVGGRHGLIYERRDGPTMLDAVRREPWRLVHYARRWAALHAQMHAYPHRPKVPPQRERLTNKIRQAKGLPAGLKDTALAALEAMPDGDRLCHGDFHPANILLTAQGDVTIDWIDATYGNPLADLARSSVILLGAAATSQIPHPIMKAWVRLFHSVYVRHYFRLCPGGEHEYQQWLPIVAAARLSEQIPELEQWLLAQASARRCRQVCR